MSEYKPVYKPDATDTFWHIVKGLMLVGHTGDMGKGDCIGETFDTFIAYYFGEEIPDDLSLEYPDLVESVMKLWHRNSAGKYYGERFPGYDMIARPMSRDHVINTMLLLYHSKHGIMLEDFVKNTPYKIDAAKHRHTIDMYCWKHAMIGNKWHHYWYYLIQIPFMSLLTIKEIIFRLLLGIGKEYTQEEWDKAYPLKISDRRRWWMRKLLFPTYALVKLGWMLSTLPSTKAKSVLKWICRPQMGSQSWNLHILFGRPVNIEDIFAYQPMTGGKLTVPLDPRNDRHCVIIKNKVWIQYNRLDKDCMLAMSKMKF